MMQSHSLRLVVTTREVRDSAESIQTVYDALRVRVLRGIVLIWTNASENFG